MIILALRIVNQLILGSLSKSMTIVNRCVKVPFRCYPVDMDTNIHMNNACYFRVAELSRWRIFVPSGLFQYCAKHRVSFIVSETHAKYHAPILPFQRYIVSTYITTSDNKWLHYTHRFEQHPDQVAVGKEPKVFAVIGAKSVLKESTGKTVPISTLLTVFNKEFTDVVRIDNDLSLKCK